MKVRLRLTRRRPPSVGVVWGGAAAAASLVLGCSADAGTYTSDADSGSTHALVTVERRTVVGSAEPEQNRAFATFVHTPPDVDPSGVARLAGLAEALPEPGECWSASAAEGPGTLGEIGRVELLDAGEVVLETSQGRVELAPRAFPAAASVLAGVVYATRERSASLPDGTSYALRANGGALRAPLWVSAEAPQVLADAALDGVPIGEHPTLDTGGTRVSWRPGSAGDRVYATISSESGRQVTCAFRDEAGGGVIPAQGIPVSKTAALSLHRLRVVPIPFRPMETGIDAGELRFDFELAATVAVRAR